MTTPAANAAPVQSGDVLSTLEQVSSESVPNGVAPMEANVPIEDIAINGASVDVEAGNSIVTIPSDTSLPIEVKDEDGTLISLTLPQAQRVAPAEQIGDGVIAYDNSDGSHTIPLVKDDGSVQVTTVIDDAQAPNRYVYDFDLPDGASLEQTEEGIAFLGGDGNLIGGVAPAWAVDAEGKTVPTWYEIEGSRITQVVAHDDKVSYPVVADPLWGTNLIQSASWILRDGMVSLSIVPTGWNRFNANFGPAITEGWKEALAKTPSQYLNRRTYNRATANTTQMYWQYQCHQVSAFFKGAWNLEPHRYRASYAQYSLNLCN